MIFNFFIRIFYIKKNILLYILNIFYYINGFKFTTKRIDV